MQDSPEQDAAVVKLKKFLDSDSVNFLLLGAAGSGKTTTITRAFSGSHHNVMFCAFTNKATSVLQNISKKFQLSFHASFSTIHSLLGLKPKYSEIDQLQFEFSESAISKIAEFDVIIFDECSTISTELYSFVIKSHAKIIEQYGKSLKFIFLGDFWQIPPVGEKNGIVFARSKNEVWPVSKLSKVMRSNNESIFQINARFLAWIDLFKSNKNSSAWKNLILRYPYNLVKSDMTPYVRNIDDLLQGYFKNKHDDSIILTHSIKSCNDINDLVQDNMDKEAKRPLRTNKKLVTKFYIGDKCCLDRPIVVSVLNRRYVDGELIVSHGQETEIKLYNGEIFDVILVEDSIINTKISRFSGPFMGQVLTIARNTAERFEVTFIKQDDLDEAYATMRQKLKRQVYFDTVSDFSRIQPKLQYGYCMTIYKSQGSQWKNVYVNLRNIWWSICGKYHGTSKKTRTRKPSEASVPQADPNESDTRLLLFKITYTAASRASDTLTLFW